MRSKPEPGDVVRVYSIPNVADGICDLGIITNYRMDRSYPQVVMFEGAFTRTRNPWGSWDLNEDWGGYELVPPEEWPDEICAKVAQMKLLKGED